jgi:hypothetical protein
MSQQPLYFILADEAKKVEFVRTRMTSWKNIFVKTATEEFKVKSVTGDKNKFRVDFDGQTPKATAPGGLYFEAEEMWYYFEGGILVEPDGFYFKPGLLYQEQQRKIIRMVVPKSYPAYFVMEKINEQPFSFVADILDIHGDGFQFYLHPALPLKGGERVVGLIRISKFPEVKVSGTVRHSATKDNSVSAGVEINHLAFTSDGKLQELLSLYRQDVLTFNKKP